MKSAAQERAVAQLPQADEAEKIADAIKRISDGTARILNAGLNRRALRVLLASTTGCKGVDIDRVIDGLSTLERDYITRKGAK